MSTQTQKSVYVTAPIEISEQRISDLIETGLYGSPWLGVSRVIRPTGVVAEFYCQVPMAGGALILTDFSVEEEGEAPKHYILDRDTVLKGLDLFSKLEPRYHFANFLSENDDAITGDVFLQLCIFEEVIYG